MSEDKQARPEYLPSESEDAPDLNRGRGTSRRAKAAVRRCSRAWWRAYNAYVEEHPDDFFAKVEASNKAATAYFNAMPLLTGDDTVGDFIACISHGIVTGILPQDRSGQLLYAAQVALAAGQRLAKKKKYPTPSPR